VQHLGSAVLHAGSKAKCRLLVQIPDRSRQEAHDFSVRQLYGRREVGRLTWRFGGQEKRYGLRKKAKAK
jgi:hypothetical protein